MARQLVLIRHAKTGGGKVDSQRSLTARGRADATEVGRLLAADNLIPDRAVVSPAARAQQTWAAAQAELGAEVDVHTDERIYDNYVDALLEIVRELPDELERVVLVGHNPSFEALAHELTGELDDGFPTAAVAVLALDGSWAEAGPGGAELTQFAVARGSGGSD